MQAWLPRRPLELNLQPLVLCASLLFNLAWICGKVSSSPDTDPRQVAVVAVLQDEVHHGRRLAAHEPSPVESQHLHDCASVACPTMFTEGLPLVSVGHAYVPRADDAAQRRAPSSMAQLTAALYGDHAIVGHVFRGYNNPFGKRPTASYKWTQLTLTKLRSAVALVGKPPRFIVEVGSFAGGSAL
eukprot:2320925-Prymnesium_polylepis.1